MKYRTIVADPPWEYDKWRSTTTPTYGALSVDEINSLPVRDLAAPDAHLYCWAVLPLMAEAFDAVRAWGFKPSTMLTWCKPGVGLGGGYRGNTEHLIVARLGNAYLNPTCLICGRRLRGLKKCDCDEPRWVARGQPCDPAQPFLSIANGTWYEAPRAEHSAKPEMFLDLIEQMSPPPRIELFARRQRLGWDTWGNEALCHVEITA